MSYILILQFFFANTFQASQGYHPKNCLQQNPTTLDGIFNMYNKDVDTWDLEDKDILDLLDLFLTRFNRVHMGSMHSPDKLEKIANAMSHARKPPAVYFATLDDFLNTTVYSEYLLSEVYRHLRKFVNKNGTGLSPRLYVTTKMSPEDSLIVYRSVFGSDIKPDIPIGLKFSNCREACVTTTEQEMCSNVQFINCKLYPRLFRTPESSADDIIVTCDSIRDTFRKKNITAEVMCQVSFPTSGKRLNGITGTVEASQKFWCRIVETRKRNTRHAVIVFFSAFDDTPVAWGESIADLHKPKYSTGWWRRVSEISNDASAFEEKVDSLEFESTPRTTSNDFYYIVGACVICVAVVILLIVLIDFLRKSWAGKQSERLTSEEINIFEHGCKNPARKENYEDGTNFPYDRSFELSKSSFIIDRFSMLGEGQHGMVCRGSMKDCGTSVAIKTSRSALSSQQAKCMLSEIKIMIYVGSHENLVRLIGANTSSMREGIVYLVMEFCEIGSLHDVLQQEEKISLICHNTGLQIRDSKTTIGILADTWVRSIASGMEHISSKNVIHGDLAARNVLISANGVAKITDFGLSRKLYEYSEYVKNKQEPLPWRWMAPESLKRMTFSTASDVWAYGITLYEIYTHGMLPYPGMAWDFSFMELLESGFKNNQPQHCDSARFAIMEACWNVLPLKRPTFTNILQHFQQICEAENEYICG